MRPGGETSRRAGEARVAPSGGTSPRAGEAHAQPGGETSERAGEARRFAVGAGCSLGCSSEELAALVDQALAAVDGTVVAVASVDRRAGEPCMTALAARYGVPLRTFAAADLERVAVPTPSEEVRAYVGTPSVAEAAALLAANGTLVVPKRRSAHATCAIAEEPRR